MIQIEGAHAAATVYTVSGDTHVVDDYARAQIQMICDTEACSGSRIRIMPDVHAGKVGPIGLTMTVGDSVLPALVGNDIGCGFPPLRLRLSEVSISQGSIRSCAKTCVCCPAIRGERAPMQRFWKRKSCLRVYVAANMCKLSAYFALWGRLAAAITLSN